jgi:energy-coupling factor transport system permease protein
MMKQMPLGVFYPGERFLHRLQARTKLLVVCWFALVIIVANQHHWHFAPYIACLALILLGSVLGGISLLELWRRVWLLLVFALFGLLFALVSTQTGSPIVVSLGPALLSVVFLRLCAWIIAGLCLLLFLLSYAFARSSFVSRVGRGLRATRGLDVFVFCLALIFLWLTSGSSERVPWTLGPVAVTQMGIWISVAGLSIFITLYLASLLMTMTTLPIALIEGMTLLLAPLRRLKLPVNDFALMVLLALRFIPTLLEEAQQLLRAQMARGADLAHGTLRERMQSLSMFFQPLMHNTLRRASELAVALEARGYQNEGKPTRLHETSLGWIDYTTLLVVLLVTLGSFLF